VSDKVELLRRGYDEIWKRGNLEKGLAGLGDDIEWIVPEDVGGRPVRRGREEVREFFSDFLEFFQPVTTDYDLEEVGDRVVVTTRMLARARGSGIETELRIAQVWTFEGARVVRMEWYRSPADAYAAIGLER
jgi:ketosteroid isomerase-like protein